MNLKNRGQSVSTEKTEKALDKTRNLSVPVSVSLPRDLNEQITRESGEIMMQLIQKGKSVRSLKSRFIQELIKASLKDEMLVKRIKSDLQLELMSKK